MFKSISLLLILLSCNLIYSQKIGLLTNDPRAPVHIASSGQVNVDGGLLLLGDRVAASMQLDFDLLQSMIGMNPLPMRIQPFGGFLGVNTLTPDAPFHVASSGQVNVNGGLMLLGDRGNAHMEMDFDLIQAKFASGTLPLRLQPEGGNVGIHTSSPQAALHVYSPGLFSATNGLLMLGTLPGFHLEADYDLLQAKNGASTSLLRIQPTGGNLSVANGDLFVNASGNMIGIMDATPSYTLDVNGNIGLLQYLYHKADDDTHLRFQNDQVTLNAGGKLLIDCYEGLLDYIKLGDGSPINLFFNDAMMVSAVDKQVAIGTDHNDPLARLHIKSNAAESALIVQEATRKIIEVKGDHDIIFGGWGYPDDPSIQSRYPMNIWTSLDPLERPALTLQGYTIQGIDNFVEGGILNIGDFGAHMLLDENEIQCYNNFDDEPLTLELNRRGGNVIIGHNQISRVGINTILEPETDLHVFQSYGSSNGAAGIKLESNDFEEWRIAINSSEHLEFYFNGTLKATLSSVNGGWSAPSDSTLKKDITPSTPLLEKVNQLQPVTYHMREQDAEDPIIHGFVAQEVQQIFPELVTEANGKLGLHYEQFSVLAIQSIKELSTKNQQLETRIADLEEKLLRMEAALSVSSETVKR